MSEVAYIGVGGNVGGQAAVIAAIVAALEALRCTPGVCSVVASPVYASAAWGHVEQPPFVNAVFAVETTLDPCALLRVLKRLEQKLGRRETTRWGPRVIDLDVLLHGERRWESDELVVPHAYLLNRAFAYLPLLDLNPEARLPSGALLRVAVAGRAVPTGLARMAAVIE